jgi:hypothetical protein
MRALLSLLIVALAACSPPSRGGPTPVPEPPEVHVLPGRGVEVDGHGSSQTDPITPQYDAGLNVGVDVVSITHDGQSTFVVSTINESGQAETLTSAVGAYQGQRPVVVPGPLAFKVTADGNWSLKVQPIASGATPNFRGTGDAVSGYFDPPAPATWAIQHDGRSQFYVYAHCLGGSNLVVQAEGAVQQSAQVQFAKGPCFWEVRADGTWSLAPQ